MCIINAACNEVKAEIHDNVNKRIYRMETSYKKSRIIQISCIPKEANRANKQQRNQGTCVIKRITHTEKSVILEITCGIRNTRKTWASEQIADFIPKVTEKCTNNAHAM